MKITERQITEKQLEEVTNLMLDDKALISLDIHDVESVLSGKEGILYEAQNDENEDNINFMKHVFDELKKKIEVMTSTYMLMNIGMDEERPLMMHDMDTLNDFFESFANEEMTINWSIKTNDHNTSMTLYVLCTHDIQKLS
jgi:hypothetical protein